EKRSGPSLRPGPGTEFASTYLAFLNQPLELFRGWVEQRSEKDHMPKHPCLWTCLSFFAAVQPALWVAVPVRAGTPAPAGAGVVMDARALTAAIDRHMAARWAAGGVKPADRADDAEFMRRVYLDLAGKIPPVSEVREFLADKTPDKRRLLVEKLLDSS